MKEVGAFHAKTHLSDLLKQTARGEIFIITRRGQPVAALSPIVRAKGHGPMEIIGDFRRKFAASLQKFSARELRELKELGRR